MSQLLHRKKIASGILLGKIGLGKSYSYESEVEICIVLGVDFECRYFVTTTISHERRRRAGNVSKKKATEENIAEVVDEYYWPASRTVTHLRCCQDDLK